MTALHFGLIALGLGLAFGPVLLHLLMQEKPKRVVFPALRFVIQKQQSARRSIRLRHWMLLALRAAVVALVALALARPAAATALFGSYLLLGVTIVSGLCFLFLTFYWRNKTNSGGASSGGAGFNRSTSSGASSSGGNPGGANAVGSAAWRQSANVWPLILLSAIVLGHVVAGGWLVWSLLGNETTTVLSGKQPVAAAILVDTSPRMQYRFNNQTRLERAQELAHSIIKQLPAGSLVSVIDSGPEPPGLSLDLAAADQQIDSLQTTYQSQALPQRARAAVELLQDSPLENHELYVISDLSRPSWSTGGRKRKLTEDDDPTVVYLVDVGVKSSENWSVDAWATPTPSITPGGVFQVRATIARMAIDSGAEDLVSAVAADQLNAAKSAAENATPTPQPNDANASPPVAADTRPDDPQTSPQAEPGKQPDPAISNRELPTETRTVRLLIEKPEAGRPVYRNGETLVPTAYWERFTQVSLSPGQSTEVSFSVPNLPDGEHQAWIEIEGGDALPFDNRRYLTVRVEQAWKSLVVVGPGVSDANLVEAIAPTGIRQRGQAAFDCKVITADKLEATAINEFKVLFLLNPAPLSETQWIQLSKYVANGGSMGIFLGHNALDSAANRPVVERSFNAAAAQRLLPGVLSDPWRRPDGTLFFEPRAWDHPMFLQLQPLKTQLGWSRLPVFMHFGLTLPANQPVPALPDPNAPPNADFGSEPSASNQPPLKPNSATLFSRAARDANRTGTNRTGINRTGFSRFLAVVATPATTRSLWPTSLGGHPFGHRFGPEQEPAQEPAQDPADASGAGAPSTAEPANSDSPNQDPVSGDASAPDASETGPAKSVRLLATYTNNIPALVETLYGQGQVITMTTPITDPTRPDDGRRPWNSFAVGGDWAFTYWLLITELSKYLATSQSAALNGTVGDSFVIFNEQDNAPNRYALYRPENQEPMDIQVDKGRMYLDFNDRPGPYRLRGLNPGQDVFLRGYSVNVPSGASQLDRVGKAQLDSLLGQGRYSVAENEDQIIRNQGKGRVGLEFYPSLIRLLAIVFLVEMLFSNWFYRDAPRARSAASA